MIFNNVSVQINGHNSIKNCKWMEKEAKVVIYGDEFTITINKVYTDNNINKIMKKYGIKEYRKY